MEMMLELDVRAGWEGLAVYTPKDKSKTQKQRLEGSDFSAIDLTAVRGSVCCSLLCFAWVLQSSSTTHI